MRSSVRRTPSTLVVHDWGSALGFGLGTINAIDPRHR